MENSGNLTAPSAHHDLDVPLSAEIAPAGVTGLNIAIRDKGDKDSRISRFTIAALGESADTMEHFNGLARPNSIIQTRMADGTSLFTQLLTRASFELLTEDNGTSVTSYRADDFAGAKEAGLTGSDLKDSSKNPVYQLLLQAWQAPSSLSLADTTAVSRAHAVKSGSSFLRRSGRLERPRRGFIMYEFKKQLFPDAIPDKPDVVRETYSTTTFARKHGRSRIDTRLEIKTLLNPEFLDESSDIVSMTGIAVRRTVLDLSGDDTTHERPANSEQAMDFVRPLFTVIAPAQNPIRYNRQRAA